MWADLRRPLSSEEMAVVESNAVALGVSLDALMERAGRAVAEEALRHLPPAPSRLALVAGPGNNGGDATCAAHYLLEWGYRPELWLLQPPSRISSAAARRCFARIERRMPIHAGAPLADELAAFPLVVDGGLGTGQIGPLREPYRAAVRAIADSRSPSLSIDLPTGAMDPDGLRPTWTLALTVPKREMDPASAGELRVVDIGIPPAAWFETGPGEFRFFPRPMLERDGRRTRVVIVGGGPYAGAPALAGLAALRSGAERATIVTPRGAATAVEGFSPNLVVRAVGNERILPSDVPGIEAVVLEARPEAIVLGMGAGGDPETVDALRQLFHGWAGRIPLVVDADALRAVGSVLPPTRGPAALVLTPNAGEYRRDFGGPAGADPDARRRHVAESAERLAATIVAKGAPDLVSDGETTAQNLHHSPFQTVAGVGDVLGGVLGHLVGAGLTGAHAGRLATYWVGDAGLRAAGQRGAGVLATDLIEELPAALVAGLARLGHPG